MIAPTESSLISPSQLQLSTPFNFVLSISVHVASTIQYAYISFHFVGHFIPKISLNLCEAHTISTLTRFIYAKYHNY